MKKFKKDKEFDKAYIKQMKYSLGWGTTDWLLTCMDSFDVSAEEAALSMEKVYPSITALEILSDAVKEMR